MPHGYTDRVSQNLLARLLLSLLISLAAACGRVDPPGPGDADLGDGDDDGSSTTCARDLDCDDRIACTIDHCDEGRCSHAACLDCCGEGRECVLDFGCGQAPTPCTTDEECVDETSCTLDRCRDSDHCEHLPQNGLCDEGEICLAALGCIPSPPSDCDSDEDCDLGRPCLGEWYCDPEFACQFLSLVECDDDDECTDDLCDDEVGGCVHQPRDGDGDGHGDERCGGDDCDDGDDGVYPGATELCDGLDDDCDGDVDEGCCGDGDLCRTPCETMGSIRCEPDGSETCVPPAEICNLVDDDCDGDVDEDCCESGAACLTTCTTTGTVQCNADGSETCVPPAEWCNGLDDDCDGTADDGFECSPPGREEDCETSCGSTGVRECLPTCAWDRCVPPADVCNGLDDNCDGRADEGFACAAGTSGPCATTCGSIGTRSCLGSCAWDTCVPPAESCNGADDNCNGAADEGFFCRLDATRDCSLLGFHAGTAICNSDCTAWNTSACTNCGNGAIDAGEDCDGTRLGGNDCTDLADDEGDFGGGALACDEFCTFDTTLCHHCGNDVVDAFEDCDGTDLDDQTCLTIPGGYDGGALACRFDCTFNTAGCTGFDPTGVFSVSPSPSYTCAFGFVSFSIGSMTFNDGGALLSVSDVPCLMTGPSAIATRHIDVTCTLPGTCDETYSLVGDFTDEDHWTGTFTVVFTPGYSGACYNCTNQSWPVTGSR